MTKEEWEEILHEFYQYRLFTNGLVQKYITRQCIDEYIKDHEINRLDNTYTDYHFDVFNTLDASDLKQLINEHFASSENRVETRDNPPLKWGELKVKMTVWDNKCREYIELHYDDFEERFWVYYFGTDVFSFLYKDEFEENRYFRYEVKE